MSCNGRILLVPLLRGKPEFIPMLIGASFSECRQIAQPFLSPKPPAPLESVLLPATGRFRRLPICCCPPEKSFHA